LEWALQFELEVIICIISLFFFVYTIPVVSTAALDSNLGMGGMDRKPTAVEIIAPAGRVDDHNFQPHLSLQFVPQGDLESLFGWNEKPDRITRYSCHPHYHCET